MDITEDIIIKALVGGHYVSDVRMHEAQAHAKTMRMPLLGYLLLHNVTSKNVLGQAIAELHSVSFVDIQAHRPARDFLAQVSSDLAKKHRAIIFKKEDKKILFVTDNPKNDSAKKELEQVFPGSVVEFAYALPEDIDEILLMYQAKLETRFMNILQDTGKMAPELIDEIFQEALAYYASDIHFEPRETTVVVRFRIDGVLHQVGELPKGYYDNILNRVKVLAKMRIDEHMNAQDGAIRYVYKDQRIDLRISIVPTIDGEKIEIRILSGHMPNITLAELGLTKRHRDLLIEASRKPFGMILVTGPTGSGKTTTLYAVLKTLNHPDVNITTIEDPVEYKITGINQIQVNMDTNLTFAEGLRSIVRQDPNIILVGEIRDTETANIAVNAALTGHLLLSTFHANDAATAIPRLLEMNVEGFILSSTIELIVAQRLVRRVCEHCRTGVVLDRNALDVVLPNSVRYFPTVPVTLYHGKGCNTCGHSGFLGRTGLFEFLAVTREIKDMILKNPNSRQLWDIALSQGSIPLFEDGIDKVKRGMTTLEELTRVAPPPVEPIATKEIVDNSHA